MMSEGLQGRNVGVWFYDKSDCDFVQLGIDDCTSFGLELSRRGIPSMPVDTRVNFVLYANNRKELVEKYFDVILNMVSFSY